VTARSDRQSHFVGLAGGRRGVGLRRAEPVFMKRTNSLLAGLGLLLLGMGCMPPLPGDMRPIVRPEAPVTNPGPLGDIVKAKLELEPTVDPNRIGHRIHQLADTTLDGDVTWETCEGVEVALADVCGQMYQSGDVESCSFQATFFYANATPRCAVRFSTRTTWEGQPMDDLFVMDFAGEPSVLPPPSCGDGVVDVLETCDDGNHEIWDGCDQNCLQEEFTGCEQVIQHEYEAAELAFVDKDSWDGPRSHLMINDGTKLAPVTQGSCEEAAVVGEAACARLAVEMPFVSWCYATTEYIEDAAGAACHVRLEAWFHQLAPETGVFTTSLPGVLAFTIR